MQSEGRRITIPYRLEAPPATKGEVSVWEVPGAQQFLLEEFEIRFPAGTAGDLRVEVLYGELRVIPYRGAYSGDGTRFVERVRVRYYAGDPIRIRYENVHATDTKYADMSFQGILE